MLDDLRESLKAVASRRGIDLEALAANEPSTFDKDGWHHNDPVGFRTEQVYKIFLAEASSEFQPHRLPPIDSRVDAWVDDQIARAQTTEPLGESERDRLFLYGSTGCGKTSHGFSAILRLALWNAGQNRKYVWRYTTHREFSAETRAWGDDANGAIERYKLADLLFFDELGGFNPTPFATDCLVRLIDHRYRNGLSTIFATNMLFERTEKLLAIQQQMGTTIPVLRDVLDDTLISRLKKSSHIRFDSVDHRVNQARVIR